MSFWLNKKVLVTGGSGLIGSHMVESLVQKGAAVMVVDNLKRGQLSNLDAVREGIVFRQEDLTDLRVCERACQGQDVVLHLASDAYGLSYNCSHHRFCVVETEFGGNQFARVDQSIFEQPV